MSELSTAAYDDLVISISQDEDDDITVTDDGLVVSGNRFAYLEGESLVVLLPRARADDLVERAIVKAHRDGEGWVAVVDEELWPELAAEAHTFVGEPATGGES